jgi:RNA polymerase sigma-70 factor (ECF subfamily)
MNADPEGDALRALLVADLDEGFAELYRRERRTVYSTAVRMTRRIAEADDLTAETFLRAYRALTGYEAARVGELRLRPWLMTILLNTWRNGVRTDARRPSQAPLDEGDDLPSTVASVESQVEAADGNRRMAAMLNALPEKQRLAVVLRHVSGMTITEIASVLGLPEGTVKSHVSRGLGRLRRLAQGADPTEETVTS